MLDKIQALGSIHWGGLLTKFERCKNLR